MATASAVSRLAALLAVPHAEETRSAWSQGTLPVSAGAAAGIKGVPLSAVARGLDQGKTTRLPLSLAVKVVKASWHADGSWPLVAADEADPTDPSSTPVSPWLACDLIRPPPGQGARNRPPEPGPAARPDPDPEDVARMYDGLETLFPRNP